jgi:hypothetical protein
MSNNRTKTEQEAFCKAWKRSGLSKTKFCKQNNISKSALYTWLNKFGNNEISKIDDKNNIQVPPVKFLRLKGINSSKILHQEGNTLEVIIPNGVRIKANASQGNLGIFLQELLKWK